MMEMFLRIFYFFARNHKRQIYLAKAIYYHAKRSKEFFENCDFKKIRDKIEEDAAYTPLAVQSFVDDELTYRQMIEAMECLGGSEDEETVIISYFYKHVILRSRVQVFNLEFVRDSWPQQRKLDLLQEIEESADDMRGYAGRTTEVLKRVLKRRLMGLQTWSETEGS